MSRVMRQWPLEVVLSSSSESSMILHLSEGGSFSIPPRMTGITLTGVFLAFVVSESAFGSLVTDSLVNRLIILIFDLL